MTFRVEFAWKQGKALFLRYLEVFSSRAKWILQMSYIAYLQKLINRNFLREQEKIFYTFSGPKQAGLMRVFDAKNNI
jgi:hypothetical protein